MEGRAEAMEQFLMESGGVYQRAAAAAAADGPGEVHSVTAERLIELWGMGELSGPQVRYIAEGVDLDLGDNCPKDIKDLAKMGNHGLQPGKCHQEIIAKFAPKNDLPQAQMVERPMLTKKGSNEVVLVEWPLNPPNHFWECWSEKYTDHFNDLTATTPQFWAGARRDDPKFHEHPMLGLSRWEEFCAPIVLHGDGGSFTKGGNTLLCFSWASLLASGHTWDTKFLLTALPKNCLCTMAEHGVDTLKTLWAYFVLFFNALLVGAHPPADPWGSAWPLGSEAYRLRGRSFNTPFRAVMWGFLGDWDWFSLFMGLPHFNANSFCWLCDVDRRWRPYNDFSDGADWRATILDAVTGRAVNPSDHPCYGIHGVSRFSFHGDLMHCGCHGVCSLAIGSAIWSILFDGEIVGDPTPI